LSVWEAKEKKAALQGELERMKMDKRWRQAKGNCPWETEWNAEGREKAREIRAKIAKMDEVITEVRASCL
jgi:heme exporter protein D